MASSAPDPNVDQPLQLHIDSPTSSPDPTSQSPPAESPPAPKSPPSLAPGGRQMSGSSPTTAGMTASSTPLGSINAARRPGMTPTLSSRGGGLTQDIQEKMRKFHLERQGAPKPGGLQPGTPGGQLPGSPSPGRQQILSPPQMPTPVGGIPSNFKLPTGMGRPAPQNMHSAPAVPHTGGSKPSLAQKRGMALPGGLPGAAPPGPTSAGAVPGGRKKPGLTLSQMNQASGPDGTEGQQNSEEHGASAMLDKYARFIDKNTGSLTFKDKAVLNSKGVEFVGGQSFSISLDEVDTLDELGKGNYGTVYKVRHSRPTMRRPGLGLAGNKAQPTHSAPVVPTSPTSSKPLDSLGSSPTTQSAGDAPLRGNSTGVVMAMKELRLELDDAKFAAIIMELDILHRCVSPFIVDFYGAFFQEGAVYICMEFMDGGSIDKLYGDGIPENVLRKITLSTTMGLKSLKDDHNIIHRDVKPTNILVNTRGQVKICDFGVSGNLVASIAKTNIGCQSYMAPERISSGGIAQAGANPGGGTYSVQSDIWSLGLTIIECALGRYPYPPETYNNIFSQLSAIVDGEPPDLPTSGYSDAARSFVRSCLNKTPNLRPTYAMLLQHSWLAPLLKPPTISEEDEEEAEEEEIAPELRGIAVADAAPGAVKPPPVKIVREKREEFEVPATTEDAEVAEWVVNAMERRRAGKMAGSVKPALHAAPLDAVTSPSAER
ncbi:MAG: hypothetical protein M1820_005366 [Bogoriella megaspora]|nr:MAG: hypothetical protein M1820_005366 [Bogoriella megaspora]